MKKTHFMQYKDGDTIIIEYSEKIFYSNGYDNHAPWEVSYKFYERFDKVPQIGDYFHANFHFVITDIVTEDELFENTPLADKYKFYKIHTNNMAEREEQMKIIEESLLLYKEKHSILPPPLWFYLDMLRARNFYIIIEKICKKSTIFLPICKKVITFYYKRKKIIRQVTFSDIKILLCDYI